MFVFLLLSWHQLKLRLLLKGIFFNFVCWCCYLLDYWYFLFLSPLLALDICWFAVLGMIDSFPDLPCLSVPFMEQSFLVLVEKAVLFIPPLCDSFKEFSTVTAYLLCITAIYIPFKISLFLHQSGKIALLDIPFFVHGYLLQNMKIWNT